MPRTMDRTAAPDQKDDLTVGKMLISQTPSLPEKVRRLKCLAQRPDRN